jgi:hypothetical protein
MTNVQFPAGPIAWLPPSPDLNPLYFYLWGHLKALVNAAPVENEEALDLNMDACQTIRNYHDIIQRMWQPSMGHVEACIEFHGGRFEHLL